MTSDLERRIQQLCSQVVATNNSEELDRLCRELQEALKEHIGNLRDQVKQYGDDARRRNPKKGE
jgi:hypothetical protein